MNELEVKRYDDLYGFEFRSVDRRRTDRAKTHDIKALWQRQHEIIGMALSGMKQTDIAQVLGISPATVNNTLNSSLGKQKLAEQREERDEHYIALHKKVKELTIKAMQTYETILNDEAGYDPELRKKTADTVVLDIAGMRAPTKVDTRSVNVHANMEQINKFKQRGIEAARESGMLVEIANEGSAEDMSDSEV